MYSTWEAVSSVLGSGVVLCVVVVVEGATGSGVDDGLVVLGDGSGVELDLGDGCCVDVVVVLSEVPHPCREINAAKAKSNGIEARISIAMQLQSRLIC